VKIPRNPVATTTTKTPFPLGTAGILLNGVSVYNANDGNTYNSSGVWYRNAHFFESYSFDSCLGHASAGTGTVVDGLYHHHTLPTCFSTASTTTTHSPLLGFALDGFPIYGPYGYTTATDSTSAIKKLVTSYATYDYATNKAGARTCWPDAASGATGACSGTALTGNNIGPSITTTYKLNTLSSTMTAMASGAFLHDWVYTAGSGDLDAYNGRFQKTPEYPNGIYCYIFTGSSLSDYPYIFGPGNYYGVVSSTSTYVTVSETTTTYFLYSSVSLNAKPSLLHLPLIVFVSLLQL
jgi:hypothetical protein